ncbi:unnamed protein product [Closterium sp. NIES-54]
MTGARRSQPCGRSHPLGQCFAQLTNTVRLAHGVDGPAPDWLPLVQTYGPALWGMSASQLVDLFGTPHAMYAVVDSSASDSVYSSVVSLGASLAEVPIASVGTCVDTSPGAAPELRFAVFHSRLRSFPLFLLGANSHCTTSYRLFVRVCVRVALPCLSRRPALPVASPCPACRIALLAVASPCPACASPYPAHAEPPCCPHRPAERRPAARAALLLPALLRTALLAGALLPACRPAGSRTPARTALLAPPCYCPPCCTPPCWLTPFSPRPALLAAALPCTAHAPPCPPLAACHSSLAVRHLSLPCALP